MKCSKKIADDTCNKCKYYKKDAKPVECLNTKKALSIEEWESAAHMLGGD